jgi:hypothetical protein
VQADHVARRRGDNTPQPIRSLRDWPNRLATHDTCNGVGAKMGLDVTKPLSAGGMTFKRIRVPGEENVNVAALLSAIGGANWREAVKR